MEIKIKLLITAGIAFAIASLAGATPVYNLASPILASGTSDAIIDSHGVAPSGAGEFFNATLTTDGPSTITLQDVAFAPGGHNGWHSHPGIVAISLISGSIEWYNAQCEGKVYSAGDARTEGSQAHYFRVVGTTGVHLMATFIIAKGASYRIDKQAPPCAAAMGLD